MRSATTDARVFLTLTFVSLFIFLLDSLNIFQIPKSILQSLTSPIQYGLYHSGQTIGSQFQFLMRARRSSQENSALKNQLANVLMENSKLRSQLVDAQSQLAQQQSLDPVTFHTTPAHSIGLTRYLLIDKGSNDGIKADQIVVYKDSFLGIIKDVSPKRSTVMLSSDPDSKIASIVSNIDGKAQGVLIGQFGSQLLLDKVLHQEPLSLNDIVYSQGTEGKLPRGLILGTVSEIIEKDNDVFKQAKIKPIVDITDLDTVFVLTD